MPKNHYFGYNIPSEQKLIEDLVTEAISIYGVPAYWLPRKGTNDSVYGESDDRYFDEAYVLPFYVATAEGWGGEREIISRFGLEMREALSLNLSRRDFDNLLSEQVHLGASRSRPLEGDLIYFDLVDPNSAAERQGTFMEINFVEHETIFYQVGNLQMYEIRCEAFRYSQETFSTGIVNIDQSFNANTSGYSFTGNTMPDSPIADNQTFEDDGLTVLDLSEDSPFGDYS
jgi:hypothetical protein